MWVDIVHELKLISKINEMEVLCVRKKQQQRLSNKPQTFKEVQKK